ncbi:hypothetical protein [Nonomuraea sp. NPDC002799]
MKKTLRSRVARLAAIIAVAMVVVPSMSTPASADSTDGPQISLSIVRLACCSTYP